MSAVDGTRLRKGERAVIGKLGPAGRRTPRRAMVRLLIEAGIIRTYLHLGSTVCLESEDTKGGAWQGRYSGRHVYYTNERNIEQFAFTARLEADGTAALTGR